MYSEKELTQLIGEVEKEFSSFLAKAENDEMSLSKAEDSEKDKKPEAKKEDKKPEHKEEVPAEEEQESESAPEEIIEEVPAEEEQESPEEEQEEEQEEGHGYDEEDVAHMDAMYASMSKPELIAHHDSVKRALDAMGMQEQEEKPEMQEQAPTHESAPMQKSEKDVVVEVKPEIVKSSVETDLLKSEIAAKSAEVTELKKTLEAVTAFVTKLVEKKAAPQGKAITQFDVIAKNETETEVKTFTQKEITAKLSTKASDPKLEKSDREAINQYYMTGQININGISHLLK